MTDPLLSISSLRISYEIGRAWTQFRARTFDAVRDVSFDIQPGETFGLVGESGSGKSTTGRAIMRLLEPADGTIHFDGHEVTAFGKRTPMWYRRAVQIVFQDPLSSLNPRRTVGDALRSAMRQAQHDAADGRPTVRELLERVGLDEHHAARLPRELSGGQRQRAAIARAIAMRPRLIVCDEAVSALDVSTQSQVLNLLDDLQQELGLSYLFIAHDLSVVRHVSHRIGVMYLGRLVEIGPAESVYTRPLHPYTQMLLEAVPVPDPVVQRERRSMRRRAHRDDQLPSPLNPPSGCAFHTRCPLVIDRCRTDTPPVRTEGGQHYRCHLPPDQARAGLPIVQGERRHPDPE